MSADTTTDDQRRARLAWRHRLLPTVRFQDPGVIADDLLALHSSDPVSVFLSVCARQQEPAITSVEAAVYEHRRLLRHHAMRRTLWLMTPATARHAHSSCTRKLTAAERRRLVDRLAIRLGAHGLLDRHRLHHPRHPDGGRGPGRFLAAPLRPGSPGGSAMVGRMDQSHNPPRPRRRRSDTARDSPAPTSACCQPDRSAQNHAPGPVGHFGETLAVE